MGNTLGEERSPEPTRTKPQVTTGFAPGQRQLTPLTIELARKLPLVPITTVDPHKLEISMAVRRNDVVVWSDRTNTSKLKRTIQELVGALYKAAIYPEGVILSTGTCLVPADPFTLLPGDIVQVTVEGVGSLTNAVVASSNPDIAAVITSRRPNAANERTPPSAP